MPILHLILLCFPNDILDMSDVIVYTSNPSTWEAKAGEYQCYAPWATQWEAQLDQTENSVKSFKMHECTFTTSNSHKNHHTCYKPHPSAYNFLVDFHFLSHYFTITHQLQPFLYPFLHTNSRLLLSSVRCYIYLFLNHLTIRL